jgi:hypothetical protein
MRWKRCTTMARGPRPDDYRKLNGVLRYSRGYANNGWSVTAMAYRGKWNCDRPDPAARGRRRQRWAASMPIDPTDGGKRAATACPASGARHGRTASKLNAYVIRNQLDLFSNFTYFMNDPVNGDQFAQPDRRVTSGFNATHTWHLHRGDSMARTSPSARASRTTTSSTPCTTRARASALASRAKTISSRPAAACSSKARRAGAWLRSCVGVRADRYRFACAATSPRKFGRPATRCSALRSA